MKKIGVFDSGIGGKSVADVLEKAFPEAEVLFVNDTANLPYGNKSPEQLKQLAVPKLEYLEEQGCDVIVVACNTVSCTILPDIKDSFRVPLVGIVPMIKPASKLTKTGIIAVCATPATLASKRYAELKTEFASDLTVLEPDCANWAMMIESRHVDKKQLEETINSVCEQGADVIVLGCTHYHWIEELIAKLTKGRAVVIQPEHAIAERVYTLLG